MPEAATALQPPRSSRCSKPTPAAGSPACPPAGHPGPVDVFKKVLRIDLQEIYNLMLRRGWTLGSEQGLRFMQAMIRLYHGGEVRLLTGWWNGRSGMTRPDAVPQRRAQLHRAIYDGARAALPGAPYITVLTDLADFPPPSGSNASSSTSSAARPTPRTGHRARPCPQRVFLTSGMILHPRFYDPIDIDVPAERARLGLDPTLPPAWSCSAATAPASCAKSSCVWTAPASTSSSCSSPAATSASTTLSPPCPPVYASTS